MAPCRCKCTTAIIREDSVLARHPTEGSGEHTGLGLTWMSLGSGSHHRPTPLSCDAWSSPWTVCCPKIPTWRPVGVYPLRATGLVLLYCCVRTADASIGRCIPLCDNSSSPSMLVLSQAYEREASVVVPNKWLARYLSCPRWHPKRKQWL